MTSTSRHRRAAGRQDAGSTQTWSEMMGRVARWVEAINRDSRSAEHHILADR
jgi:hypothetical protein